MIRKIKKILNGKPTIEGAALYIRKCPKGIRRGLCGAFSSGRNLPAKQKMMAPCYRDVKKSAIPEVKRKDGTIVKIICGKMDGTFIKKL